MESPAAPDGMEDVTRELLGEARCCGGDAVGDTAGERSALGGRVNTLSGMEGDGWCRGVWTLDAAMPGGGFGATTIPLVTMRVGGGANEATPVTSALGANTEDAPETKGAGGGEGVKAPKRAD